MEFGHPGEEGNPLLVSVGITSHYIVNNPQQYHSPVQEPLWKNVYTDIDIDIDI